MLHTFANVRQALLRLHRSEQGAEGLEKLLIIAAIALPLLGVLLIFRQSITTWISDAWTSMLGKSNVADPAPGQPATP
jgi:Flp pilus assembly pilin Flp